MRAVRAKKQLGQHFLKDSTAASQIAKTVAGCHYPLLEVGPGMGMLTDDLLENHQDFLAIEKDWESVQYLRSRYPEHREKFVEGDFLQIPLEQLFEGRAFALIGNYPYNISSQILFRLLEDPDRIPLCSGMLQKEVAQRICSGPGTKDYGILSVLLQAWYQADYLFTVPAAAFDPPPKVDGGVLLLRRNERKSLGCDEKLFKQVVKTAFNRRRKTLRNALKPLTAAEQNSFQHPFLDLRAERLGVEDFIALTIAIDQYLSTN